MDKPDFSQGYHERWESWLHWIRKHAVDAGTPLTLEEENQALRRYLTEHHAVAHEPVRCEICCEEIANCRLAGRDPFAVPPAVKAKITLWQRRAKTQRRGLCKI